MRTSSVSTLQIELDFFAVAPVVAVVPGPAPFTPRVIPSSFRWLEEPEFESALPRIKLADNMAALRLLKRLQADGRSASTAEQAVLARYNGWGGLSLVFEPNPRNWQAEAQELKSLLAPEEFTSARATVTTAFYTPWFVVKAIYSALERMGFNGGKVLEPSAGPGIFPAVQPDSWKLDWHCVEIDTVSAGILKHLQPDATVHACGLQDVKLADGSFDLVIGNAPFGDYPVHCRRLSNPLIHDYFLLRSAELVRPGGIVALITSRGTLDKSNSNIRERLASSMDLIGAIRLPESTFTKRALTTVTTDILFLQRRSNEQSSTDRTWIKTGKLQTPTGDVEINQYFIQHPEMILGKMVANMGRYGEPACQLNAGDDLPTLLEASIQRLPANRYHIGEHVLIAQDPIEESKPVVKESGYWVRRDGTVWRQENGQLAQLDGLGAKRIQRIKGLLRVRDAARATPGKNAPGSPADAHTGPVEGSQRPSLASTPGKTSASPSGSFKLICPALTYSNPAASGMPSRL